MLKSKKAKDLIPKTAEELEMSEELVTDVVNFYYTELRKKIENLEDIRIGVPNIGTFTARKKSLEKSVATLTRILTDGTEESFKKIRKYKLTEDVRDLQLALFKKIEKDEQERKQAKLDLEE